MNQIQATIIQRATDLGWTMYRVAKEAGISPQKVQLLYQGRQVTIDTVDEICKALDLVLTVNLNTVMAATSEVPGHAPPEKPLPPPCNPLQRLLSEED